MTSSILKLIDGASSFIVKMLVVAFIALPLSLFFGKPNGLFPEMAGTAMVFAVGVALFQISLSTLYRLFSENVHGGSGYPFPSELAYHIAHQIGQFQLGFLFSLVLYYLGILIVHFFYTPKLDLAYVFIVGMIESALCLLVNFYSPKGFYEEAD